MAINKNLFRSKIALRGDTQTTLAEYLGISEASLSNKVNGKTEFVQSEISTIASRYDLSPSEVTEIFFA